MAKTFLEYLEQDKEKLNLQLTGCETLEGAVKILGDEADRLLYLYNTDEKDDFLRGEAARLIRTARAAFSATDITGEVDRYEKKVTEKPGLKGRIISAALFLSGIGFQAGAVLMPILKNPGSIQNINIPALVGLFAAGPAVMYISGVVKSRFLTEKVETVTMIRPDPQKAYAVLRNTAAQADKELEEAAKAAGKREGGSSASSGEDIPDEAQLALFADLLEADAAGDGQAALDKIADVRFYLHTKGIEAVDHTEAMKDGKSTGSEWFDRMPGMRDATIRPALVKDGKLIRKGVIAVK